MYNPKYFKMSEFECKCGCGENRMNEDFIRTLDLARKKADIPFVINSGYRCNSHNEDVGSNSLNHVKGVAVDIRCINSYKRFKIIKSLLSAGFTRIGVHKDFIHVDNNYTNEPEVIWLY